MKAQIDVEKQINFTLKKSTWFDQFENKLNDRQVKVMRRMMQAGPSGFEGGMSAKKYMAITGISKATATRDLQDLLTMGAVKQLGEGRSIRYNIALASDPKTS